MDIIRISWICPNFVDIIFIGHVMRYLSRNVRPIFRIYSSSVSDWCITSFSVCDLICFSVPSSFHLLVLWVSINWILTLSEYMCLLLSLQSKLGFIFWFICLFLCCIGVFLNVLYEFRVVCVLYKCVLVFTPYHHGNKLLPSERSLQCICVFWLQCILIYTYVW